jgi:hypothetical protein
MDLSEGKKQVSAPFPIVNGRKVCIPLIGALLILLVLPIKMGMDANKDIPVIGYMESISKKYCDEIFKQAFASYVATGATKAAISFADSFTVSLAVVSVSPGKLLRPAMDTLDRLQAGFSVVMLAMLAGKLTIGLLSFFCIKLMLPAAIILKILHIFCPQAFAFSSNLTKSLVKMALLIWFLFPAGAAINLYVQSAYTNNVYDTNIKEVEIEKSHIDAISGDISADAAVTQNDSQNIEEKGFFDSTTEKLKSLKESVRNISLSAITDSMKTRVKSIVNSADKISAKLFQICALFILQTLILPVALLLVFYFLVKQGFSKNTSLLR